MNHSKFFVTQFENSSGSSAWRVEGRINGVRFRRNFKTKEEAAAEKAALELRAVQGSSLQSVATSLSEAKVREAEAAFHRLADRTRSLTFYLDYALTNYRDPVNDKPVVEAAKEYLTLREADHKQGNLSHRQYTSFRCELRALETTFGGKLVSELTAAALSEFFRRGAVSKKSYNNRRGLISAFLKYCLLKDWVAVNVIDKVPHFRGIGHRRGSAPTLTAQQCADIMEWAEKNHDGALVPFVALCLFAGIRPDLYEGEISKLEAKDVRLDTGIILIEPEVSKVRMKRAVTIQPNLAAWLRAYCKKFLNPSLADRFDVDFSAQFNPAWSIQENCWNSDGVSLPKTGFYLDGRYHTIFTLKRWPSRTYPGIIYRLTGLPFLDYQITVNLEPLPAKREVDKEEKAIERLRGEYEDTERHSLLVAIGKKERKIESLSTGFINAFAVTFIHHNVTPIALSHLSPDGKLELPCEISLLSDPRPGLGKILTVDYSFEGKRSKKSFTEHEIARLPENLSPTQAP